MSTASSSCSVGSPGWERAEPAIAPLAGGITNRNYRVDVDGRAYVVRIPGERTELLGIDRAGEAEASRRAADAGPGAAGRSPSCPASARS